MLEPSSSEEDDDWDAQNSFATQVTNCSLMHCTDFRVLTGFSLLRLQVRQLLARPSIRLVVHHQYQQSAKPQYELKNNIFHSNGSAWSIFEVTGSKHFAAHPNGSGPPRSVSPGLSVDGGGPGRGGGGAGPGRGSPSPSLTSEKTLTEAELQEKQKREEEERKQRIQVDMARLYWIRLS